MCVKARELICKKDSLSAACRYHRGGNCDCGQYQVSGRSGTDFESGIGPRSACPDKQPAGDQVAKLILKTLGLRQGGVEVVSCPTCGRTQIDLIGLANQVETLVQGYPLDIKVAVMGCVVAWTGARRNKSPV